LFFGKGETMARTADRQAALRHELNLKLELAELLGNARLDSPFARNLSAAAREARISPSYLHKIEGAEVMASAEVYRRLCEVYGLPTGPVMCRLGKLDPALREKLVARMDKLFDVLEALVEMPDESIPLVMGFLQEQTNEGSREQATGCVEAVTPS